MATILVWLETQDGRVKPAALEAAAAAARLATELGGEAVGGLAGAAVAGLVPALGGAGLRRVYVTEDPALEHFTQEGFAQAIALQMKEAGASHLFAAHTVRGRDLAPRVAQRFEAGMASDVISLEVKDGALLAERPIYAGKLIAKVEVQGSPAVYTLRPKAFREAAAAAQSRSSGANGGGPASVPVAWSPPPGGLRTRWKSYEAARGAKIEVSDAEYLVCGGRGVRGSEGFALLEELADALGGAVCCSRPVAEAGWREHREHVGQTGRVVSPTLYVACGISGAIQHMAGVTGARVIVAINKDPNAPVFEKADYGIVGDLFEVVPRLTQELKNQG